MKFQFLIIAAIFDSGAYFKWEPPKDHPKQIWFDLVLWFQHYQRWQQLLKIEISLNVIRIS
jgi:hypothetical protein